MKTNTQSDWYTEIDAKDNAFSLNLRELWKYRDLVLLFTKRTFVLIYKQTILGPIWIFLNPFLTSVVFTLVFGRIAGIETEGVPHIAFYLLSSTIWALFATSVTKNAQTFLENANVFGKVYFPRLTVSLANVLSALIQFMIQMIMVLAICSYYTIQGVIKPDVAMLPFIPVALLHLSLLGLGTGIIISSLTTKYRDLNILITFGIQLWMYGTPIVYPLSQINNNTIRMIIMLNPVTAPVEMLRRAILGVGNVDPIFAFVSVALTIVIVVAGILVFNKVEKTFIDTV